jgi:hypothetical protein
MPARARLNSCLCRHLGVRRSGRVRAVFDDFWLTSPERPKLMLKSMIDALGHNGDTAFGVLVCLETPTRQMNEAALEQDVWTSAFDGKTYRRIQIMTAQDILDGKRVEMPQRSRTRVFAEAGAGPQREGHQQPLSTS